MIHVIMYADINKYLYEHNSGPDYAGKLRLRRSFAALEGLTFLFFVHESSIRPIFRYGLQAHSAPVSAPYLRDLCLLPWCEEKIITISR